MRSCSQKWEGRGNGFSSGGGGERRRREVGGPGRPVHLDHHDAHPARGVRRRTDVTEYRFLHRLRDPLRERRPVGCEEVASGSGDLLPCVDPRRAPLFFADGGGGAAVEEDRLAKGPLPLEFEVAPALVAHRGEPEVEGDQEEDPPGEDGGQPEPHEYFQEDAAHL